MKSRLFLLLLCALSISGSVKAETSKRLVILGDSLTEGYGVAKDSAYPALLETLIRKAGKSWTVINAGVTGSTTASGPSRMEWQLKNKPDLMILALGANDGLRGISLNETEKNLAKTIEQAQKAQVKVIIAGMLLPPNYGEGYRNRFSKMYVNLAKKYKIPKIPFLLEGVAGDPKLNQADGIHPNEKGHEIMAKSIFKSIQDQL